MATGNTLESLSAAWLLSRIDDFDRNLGKTLDFLHITAVGAASACISALIGPYTLLLQGYLSFSTLFHNILHWWQADELGIILGTPLILVWQKRPHGWFSRKRRLETICLFLSAFWTGQILFLDWYQPLFGHYVRGFWVYIFIVWAAMRYGKHGVLLIIAMTAIQALNGAAYGIGFFRDDLVNTGLQVFWCYMLITGAVGIVLAVNVEEREVRENTLREREEQLRFVLEGGRQGFWDWNLVTNQVRRNPRWAEMLGYRPEEMQHSVMQWSDLIHPDDRPMVLRSIEQHLLGMSDDHHAEYRMSTKNGEWRWIQDCARVVERHADGSVLRVCGTQTDVTEHKAVEEQLKLAALVYQNCSEAMMVMDSEYRIIDVNPAFTLLTGFKPEEVVGRAPKILDPHNRTEDIFADICADIAVTGHWQGEICGRHKNGELRTQWMSVNTIDIENSSTQRSVALFSDITEKKRNEALIWNQANYDSLTQLPNRRLFNDRLNQEIKKAQRDRGLLGLFFLDLDRFKEVNDTLGHHRGDELLMVAAQRIRRCVRDTDTVARLGGDEFTVIVTDLNDSRDLDGIAENLIVALARPFELGSEQAYVSASIGITVFPHDGHNSNELIKNADQAMYSAKQQGRNCFRYFTQSMQLAAQQRMTLGRDLRIAIDNDEFELYFQPIVDLASGTVKKAEALIRWRHEQMGLISPGVFIPIAEETGVIHPIGDWVFEQAVRQVKLWRTRYHPAFQISINKSPVQFLSNNDTQIRWPDFIKAQQIDGDGIVIEITESSLLHSGSIVTDKLLKFRDAGFQIAIDDFGTGYSALSYLNKFDIDYLKIDQLFVRNLALSPNDLALTEAIVVMAHKLGLLVIAEGVETAQQLDILKRIGCDCVQGYWVAKPLSVAEFERLLDSKSVFNT